MVRASSAVCIGFLSVLLFYGLRTHFLALQYGVSAYNQMEAASVELSTESDCIPPTYSIAAIIFHTAPVRACRYPPEDENDDGEMDHRLNLLLILSSRSLELSAIRPHPGAARCGRPIHSRPPHQGFTHEISHANSG